MADESKPTERFSLSRWSRRKLAAARSDQPAADVAPPPAVPASAPSSGSAAIASVATPAAIPAGSELPNVDALTFESDFGAFLKPEVDQATQRAALKKLFSDPRFNVMDGLDTYIDDYTQADPMPAGMLDKLGNVYALLNKDAPAPDAQSAPAEAEPPAVPSTAAPAIDGPTPIAEAPVPATSVPVAESRKRAQE
jgi:hypothetical protein